MLLLVHGKGKLIAVFLNCVTEKGCSLSVPPCRKSSCCFQTQLCVLLHRVTCTAELALDKVSRYAVAMSSFPVPLAEYSPPQWEKGSLKEVSA